MNILWFTWKDRANPLAGGAEVVNEELAARLAKAGHKVTLVVAGFPGAPTEAATGGYRIIRVGSRFTVYLAAWLYYRRHLRGWADLVIDECNTMPFFAGWYSGKPTILFFHMLCREIWFYELPPPLSLVGYLIEPLYLRLLKPAPIVTVSESTRRDLIGQGFARNSIQLISEGTELEPVHALTAVQKYPDPTMLSLGAMRSMKRTLDQVHAFEIARIKLPNLKLIVAGDATSAYGQKVVKAIKTSRYADDISYLGRVSKAKKLELMQKCHVITVTSVKEGWGLIVTEAAGQGTPAVVYDVDGLRDSVRTGQTGLITAANPEALAHAVTALLSDPDRYASIRKNAWQWSQTITFDRSYADFSQALGIS